MKAYEYCKNAATTMEQRGKENGYDGEINAYNSAMRVADGAVASFGKTVKAANFGVVAQDVQPMVVLTGEDGSKILMTPEDFRNMEKTLVRSALK